MPMNLYRNFKTQSEIDREYNAVLMIPDLRPYIESDAKANEKVCNDLYNIPDLKYGPTPNETLDIFPAENPCSPVFVFIHGGYWRSMSSRDFSLVARGPVGRGVTVVLPNYSLCPAVSIPEITRQTRASIVWVYQNISRFNGDPDRIFIGGHSAGGDESFEFKRQSECYNTSLLKKGLKSELFIQSGKNHFTSFRELNDPDSLLSNTLIEFMENCE